MKDLKRPCILYLLLLGSLLPGNSPITTAQDQPDCDIVEIKAAIIAQLDGTKTSADLAEFYSQLTQELSACGYLSGQLPIQESIWQLSYGAGNPWIRQCPDGQEIAYPAYEMTLTSEGHTLDNGSGGTLDYTHDGVYVLTAPYSLRNSTILTERWQVVDEETITGSSWDYYPDLNCLLETPFELHRQGS